MADQIERLIAAVEEVGRKLTRLSSYSRPLSLGRGVVTAISSVVAYGLSFIPLSGSSGSTSGATGTLGFLHEIEGSVAGSSGATGVMNKTVSLSGSVTATTSVSAFTMWST